MARERRSRFANPVALLVDSDVMARYGQWLESLLICLVDEGLNPILASPTDVSLSPAVPERAVLRLACPPAAWPWLRRWGWRRLLNQLAGEPLRLILACSGRLAPSAAWLARQLDVPLAALVTAQDEVPPVAATAEHLACAFAGSKALADQLTDRLARRRRSAGAAERPDPVTHIGLGVHLGERTGAFSRAGQAFGILAAGPLEPSAHFEQFLAACAQLNERRYEAEYFVIGSGSAERSLRRLAHERGLADRLTFVPEFRRIGQVFEGIDVFVQPYVCRRLDLRLLEAMAAGVVVLARNGGALDYVRDGVNGVELAQGDHAELTLLLQRLLDEPPLGRRIGQNARQFIHDNHLAGDTAHRVVLRISQLALPQRSAEAKGGHLESGNGQAGPG